MKVVFFSPSFYPSIGGVEKHAFHVGKELVARGYGVTIITEQKRSNSSAWREIKASAKATENIAEMAVFRMPEFPQDRFKKFKIWHWVWKHRKVIEQADIVHCHDVFIWYLPFRFMYPFKKVYTTFHGWEGVYPPRKKAIVIRKISEWLSAGNICIGEFITKWYDTKADIILYGGVAKVNPSSVNRRIRKERGKIKIVFVGRLEKDTGIDLYLQGLELLKQKHFAFAFEAYGDGPMRHLVETYGKVHGFIDNIEEENMDADVLFVSSYLAILEAFAKKIPIISVYDNPLKKDYLAMTPFRNWVTIAKNPDEVIDGILSLKNNQGKRKQMVEKAYEWVKTQTWEAVEKQYEKLWKII